MSAEDKSINLSDDDLVSELEWWRDIILTEDGQLSLPHTLQELHDFRFIMEEASKVYAHVTCDMMSKPGYYAKDVIQQSDECADEYTRVIINDVLDRLEGGETIDDIRADFPDPDAVSKARK